MPSYLSLVKTRGDEPDIGLIFVAPTKRKAEERARVYLEAQSWLPPYTIVDTHELSPSSRILEMLGKQ